MGNSPLGVSLGYLIGLFSSLKQTDGLVNSTIVPKSENAKTQTFSFSFAKNLYPLLNTKYGLKMVDSNYFYNNNNKARVRLQSKRRWFVGILGLDQRL